MRCWVHIFAGPGDGRLSIGVTSDFTRRVLAHRKGTGSRFVRPYRVTRLLHAEARDEIEHISQRNRP